MPLRATAPVPDHSGHHATGWAFVLEHARTIDRMTAHFCSDSRIDRDDLRQETCLWIARLHASYDPSRSAPSSWIWWMARRARQSLLERANRRDRLEVHVENVAPIWHDAGMARASTETRITVRQVLGRANRHEYEACLTVLDDLDCASVPKRIGITATGRDRRIQRLARSLAT
jgi:hypothetical protein